MPVPPSVPVILIRSPTARVVAVQVNSPAVPEIATPARAVRPAAAAADAARRKVPAAKPRADTKYAVSLTNPVIAVPPPVKYFTDSAATNP